MQAFFDTPPAASASEMIVCSARMVFSAGPPPLKITALPALCGLWLGLENSRRRCLVANRATLPQKWPPPPRDVAYSCELRRLNKRKGGGAETERESASAVQREIAPCPPDGVLGQTATFEDHRVACALGVI